MSSITGRTARRCDERGLRTARNVSGSAAQAPAGSNTEMHHPVASNGSRFPSAPAFAQPKASALGHEVELGRPDVAELDRVHGDPAPVLERDQLTADPLVRGVVQG